MSRTKSDRLFYPPSRRDENFAYPTYKPRKNGMDPLTSRSAQFCVGSHTTPSAVLFWAASYSNATTICDVWFALPHPLPKGKTMHLFLCYMNVIPRKGSVSCCNPCTANRPAPAQLHRTCSTSVHPMKPLETVCLRAWKDEECQHGRAVQNRDVWRTQKLRHYCEQ